MVLLHEQKCPTRLVMPERYKVMNPAMLGDALEND
jgi:hypothetical protein